MAMSAIFDAASVDLADFVEIPVQPSSELNGSQVLRLSGWTDAQGDGANVVRLVLVEDGEVLAYDTATVTGDNTASVRSGGDGASGLYSATVEWASTGTDKTDLLGSARNGQTRGVGNGYQTTRGDAYWLIGLTTLDADFTSVKLNMFVSEHV